VTRAWYVVGLFFGSALLAVPSPAAEDPVDPELLEFLGSVDANGQGWQDYLATTDVDELVKSQAAKPAGPGSTPPASETEKWRQP
jgi:hypothetical protein